MFKLRISSIFWVWIVTTILLGCSSDGSTTGGGGAPAATGFVVTTDFSVGNLSTITETAPRTAMNNVLSPSGLHPDSVIRTFSNQVFIIQRFGSNSIVVIDSDNPSVPIDNYTTNDPGAGAPQSNPVDMAFVSLLKAYVTRYGLNTILIANPMDGTQLGTIDLSAFADSDGVVEMDGMVIVNGKLYVALQRLNNFSASNDSYIVVIDTATDQVIDLDPAPGVQPIVLQGRNPFGKLIYLPSTDRIYIADVGNFSTGDAYGGIEAINPNTNMTNGIIIPDETFGGYLGTLAILSDTVAYAVVAVGFNNFVRPFNISTMAVNPALTGIGSGYLPGMAFDNSGFLYVTDQDLTNPGIQVFDTGTNTKVEGPISTGLPPFEIAFVGP